MNDLRRELEAAINHFSAENVSNTPDFILAQYLINCLAAFDAATNARELWYGRLVGTQCGEITPNAQVPRG